MSNACVYYITFAPMLIKALTISFVIFLTTSTWIITSAKKRKHQGQFRIGLGVFLLCIVLVFFLLR